MALEETTTKPDYLQRVTTHLVWDRLEEGDEVAYIDGQRSYYGTTVKMYTVDRLTATQIIMADGSRWYRKNGQQVAANSSEALRHPLDDEVISSEQQREMRAFKRELENAAKQRTMSVADMRALQRGVATRTELFGQRINAMEVKRRAPRAEV